MSFEATREPTDRPREMIAKGSKSFFLASLFFAPRERSGAWDLYSWCRHCDDVIDSSAATNPAVAELEAYRRLAQLRSATGSALIGLPPKPGFAGLARLAFEFALPSKYPFELLTGFEMDVRGERYDTLEDLLRYAYHVAGVVGVMMCYVMGVSDRRALRHAIDLGNAMQLTNIARDVYEDAAMGRLYLPRTWLSENEIAEVRSLSAREAVHQARLRLLDAADEFYESGCRGLEYLPLRAATAVSIAGAVYSAIGRKIRAQGAERLNERAHLSRLEKLGPVCAGLLRVLPLVAKRLRNPWRQAPLLSDLVADPQGGPPWIQP